MSTIVILGGGGTAGRLIAAEAVARGHDVTVGVRHPDTARVPVGVTVVTADATDADAVRTATAGADVVIITVGGAVADAARTVAGAVTAGTRIVHFGGGATLTAPDGGRFLDSPLFPDEYREIAAAHADALAFYRAHSDLSWTFFSPPPIDFAPGTRVGTYRTGLDEPVYDDQGNSRLSYEDAAIAVLDEVENPAFPNARFTAGY